MVFFALARLCAKGFETALGTLRQTETALTAKRVERDEMLLTQLEQHREALWIASRIFQQASDTLRQLRAEKEQLDSFCASREKHATLGEQIAAWRQQFERRQRQAADLHARETALRNAFEITSRYTAFLERML